MYPYWDITKKIEPAGTPATSIEANNGGNSVTSVSKIDDPSVFGSIFDPTEFAKWYNDLTSKATQEQRDWSEAQAQKQMDFQERLASTQWQRAVEDMHAAGLNPYLAYTQGGNSAASGAQATSSTQDIYGNNDVMKLMELYISVFSSILGSASKLGSAFIGLI